MAGALIIVLVVKLEEKSFQRNFEIDGMNVESI